AEKSRAARSAEAGGTKRSRGISSMALRMRRSVTSAVRTCPSTICRRAVAKSVIAVLDLKTCRQEERSFAATSRKTQVSPCECHVIVGGLSLLYRHGRPDALISQVGHVAEWGARGVRTRARRFDSGRGLQYPAFCNLRSHCVPFGCVYPEDTQAWLSDLF